MVEFPMVPITELFRLKQGTYLKADEMQEGPCAEFPFAVYGANGVIGYANRKMYSQRTTLVSCRGANCGVVHFTAPNVWISNNSIACIPATGLDPTFYYYVCLNTNFGDVITGSAQPQITITNLSSKQLIRPPLHIQRRIAGILSAYDELMENCQRRIRILEEMARALYREWFVHFRFPGHEKVPRVDSSLGPIPKGWDVKQLKDVANVTYGFPFQSKKFNTTGVGTPVIRIRDILDGSTGTFTDEPAEPKYHIKDGDILVGMDGDFHMCIWSSGHALQNQRVAKFESRGEIGNYHLFLALELPIQTWNNSIVGTTVAHLGDMHIKTIQLAWPPNKLLTKVRDVLEPMSEQIIALKRRIANLRRTRDLLLPRLLSGQVPFDVSEDVAEPTTSAPPPAETDFASEEPDLPVAEEAPPWQVERAGNSHPSPAQHADETPMPIHQTERTDVLQIIRQVFSEGPPRPRDDAIRDVARALGYRRTGARIQEVLHGDLLTAARRGILENIDGTLRLCARSITDLDRDFLKQQFLAAIGRPWIDRDTATRDFCRWLGFARTGPVIEDTARSLINGLLREGRLEADGAEMIRRA